MNQFTELFYLDPQITFLNHGSFGAAPKCVLSDTHLWQMKLETQPVAFFREAPALLAKARTVLANYLGTQADNLVFVPNATYGINVVVNSLNLGPEEEVLTTNHEYGAMDRAWKYKAQQHGFRYINQTLPFPIASSAEIVDTFRQAVTPHTRVIFLSQITSPTAVTFPVKEICQLARERGILSVIDGAHAPGQINLDLEDLGADFYTGNLHKWLCAAKGSAFLYCRPEIQSIIQPLVVSWGWQAETPGASQFNDYMEWIGTRDLSPFLSVPRAIQFQTQLNWSQIRQQCHQLASQCRQQIQRRYQLPEITPDRAEFYQQMGAVQLPSNLNLEALKLRMYNEFKVEIPLIRWEERNLIRFSFQIYNDEKDIQQLMQALTAYAE